MARPNPKLVSTVNTQPLSNNFVTTKPDTNSAVTYNPQIKTQNDIVRPSPVTTSPPIQMTYQSIWNEAPAGRPDIVARIKTSFTPTDQQLRVLQAMEKQKQAEKDQARKNSEWQKNQDRLQAQKQQMEAERQKTEDFKNRTNEEILQNFIKTQTTKELAGQFDNPEVPTNLNQYLAERGFDVTRPQTIPTSIFKPTKLDTREKLIEAGVAPRIINMRLSIDNPNDTVTNVMTNTQIQPSQNVNWNGITENQKYGGGGGCAKCCAGEKGGICAVMLCSCGRNNLYTPPNATNINQPIGRSTPLQPSVTTTGLSPPRTTLVTEVIESVNPIPSNLSSLALLAGAFILT